MIAYCRYKIKPFAFIKAVFLENPSPI